MKIHIFCGGVYTFTNGIVQINTGSNKILKINVQKKK